MEHPLGKNPFFQKIFIHMNYKPVFLDDTKAPHSKTEEQVFKCNPALPLDQLMVGMYFPNDEPWGAMSFTVACTAQIFALIKGKL